jgi:hypothetical protein
MSIDILTVDTKGLSKLTSRNGLDWIAAELIQNAWDQDVSGVDMAIESAGHGRGRITVTDDDPQGFLDLTHAYTLFAESNKKGDATLRGRFNLGEKLVIAYCVETGGFVEILTTSGGYSFSKKEGRKRLRRKTEVGSRVTAEFRASRRTLSQMVEYVQTFIAPTDFPTTVNGEELLSKPPLATFDEFMPTVSANDDGDLFRTTRKTTVEIIETRNGEQPMIYEMGIPVVENPTKYHINVQQKVPLNMERNAVTPAYSRKVCALVLNATRDLLTKEEASKAWVAEAMESDDIESESVTAVLDKVHGKRRVMHDPNNPEASAAAIAAGYGVVYGGNHSKKAHGNIRKHSPVASATDKMKDAGVDFHPDGKDVTIPREKWTEDMRLLAEHASDLHGVAHGYTIPVLWVNDPRNYGACYGDSILMNKRRLGTRWITDATSTMAGFERFLCLVIHECAHKHASSHFNEDFHKGCSRIGAAFTAHLAGRGIKMPIRDQTI